MPGFKDKPKDEILHLLDDALKKIAQSEDPESEYHRIRQALNESEEQFRSIILASPMGIHMYELDARDRLVFQGANPAADNILGLDNSKFIGKTIEEAFPPLKDTEIPLRYRRAAAYGETWRTEQVTYEDNKISGVFEVYAFQTGTNSMAAMFLDITKQKKTEEALLFTQFTIDHMADAAYWMGPDARFIYVNNAACRSLGYSRNELLELSVTDIDADFTPEIWATHWLEIKKQGSFSIESHHRRKDGHIFPVEVTVNYVEFAGKEYNCAFVRNISNRRQAEQELKDSEEKYRDLVELSNDAIYILYQRKFVVINEKFKQMFQVTKEYVNKPGFDFTELVAPKSRAMIEERNQRLARGEEPSRRYYFTAISTDGREIEIEASVNYIHYKDGIAVQGILRDVTERLHIEEKLRQAQKLEAVSTLAGGIAHDFNNILMGIQGSVSVMLLKSDSSFFNRHLEGIESYVERGSEVTKRLLSFARGGKTDVKSLDLNDLIKRSIRMFGRSRKEIEIHEDYQDNIWAVEVDAGQIEQVMLNLFINAWQAMPAGGFLQISTANVTLDEEDTQPYQAPAGRYVKISIADTGVGMDQTTKERIFDPFFTTKETGQGSGLGLASVYGIVKNHSGFIAVFSEKGKGTTFKIHLPAADVELSRVEPQSQTGALSETKRTAIILLVDDDEAVMEVTPPLLEVLGYSVLKAVNGKEAEDIYRNSSEGVDLVILDIVLPDVSSGEVYYRLKNINPQVKVLLSTGGDFDDQAAELLEKGCSGFIQKPFTLEQLAYQCKKILEN